jgi:outer membrane receptor protein involved in Fe transport
MEQVVVTAQKKSESLMDVPMGVSVVEPQKLIEANQTRLQDYYLSVPGLGLTAGNQGDQILVIRGITTGSGGSTVGVVIDDVPFGQTGANLVPDLDPSDLVRIEALKGPQGSLYGASSMGGLLKFVTADPSTDALTGRVEAGVSDVYRGSQPGYNMRASTNIPIGEPLAVRASVFTRQDPGYIDNPVLGIHGINSVATEGGHLSGLWHPSDAVSLKLSALVQESNAKGSNDVTLSSGDGYIGPPLGDLQQNYIRGVGGWSRRIQAYSATLNVQIGRMTLTSITGYNTNKESDSYDFTSVFGPFTQDGFGPFPGFGVTGTPLVTYLQAHRTTEELRLSGSIAERFDMMLGLFGSGDNFVDKQYINAEDTNSGQIVGQWVAADAHGKNREYAVFANVTYHVTPKLDVQVGGRESEDKIDAQTVFTGPYDEAFLGQPSPVVQPRIRETSRPFTYLFATNYKFTSDLMAYIRLASGFRPGGGNANGGGAIPFAFRPDKTKSNEIGLKASFLDHRLSIDTALYYIDWKDIQIGATDAQTSLFYVTNGARAKSEGLDFSVEGRPLPGLVVTATGNWAKSVLTEDFPPETVASGSSGLSGDRLPFTSRFSGGLTVEQNFVLSGDLTGFVNGSVNYVGDRPVIFQPTEVRPSLPAYARADARTGIKDGSWTTTIFVNNIADRRGVLNGGLGYSPTYAYVYIQPRTFGISVSKSL